MLTRLYAHNFRCLLAFEAQFDSFGVLCGPNGAGKSSVFDALRLIRNLATGDGILGGEGERDIAQLEFTKWQAGSAESTIQEFELSLTAEGVQVQGINGFNAAYQHGKIYRRISVVSILRGADTCRPMPPHGHRSPRLRAGK